MKATCYSPDIYGSMRAWQRSLSEFAELTSSSIDLFSNLRRATKEREVSTANILDVDSALSGQVS
jgi:hypothetical protein